ncbi:MAG: hypothetical protein N2Z72_01345 [Bacteroidales bacterium]|nr:hypothetical protein [Bacteroidales bacterium]
MKKIDRLVIRFLSSLSILGGATGIVISLISILYPSGLDWISKIPGYANIKLVTLEAHWSYPYIKLFLYAISLWGAFEIFLFRRRGFWLYTSAQVMLLIIPYFLWNKDFFLTFLADLPDLYITFAFIGSYALYYHALSSKAGSVK